VQFLTIDIDNARELAESHDVVVIPSVRFFEVGTDGELLALGATTGSSGPAIREKLAEFTPKEP
jgi:hypothetical protein